MSTVRAITKYRDRVQSWKYPDKLDKRKIASFHNFVKDYRTHALRAFPWRNNRSPYRVLVSEFMLQQTQASRVAVKFPLFLKHFPSFSRLANAKQNEVLSAWQGLGYNRRALNLHKASKHVVRTWNSRLPADPKALQELPGVGEYTSRAICVFAFKQPHALIETNIRAVMIYFFLNHYSRVHDSQIEKLVLQTMDETNPDQWFDSLMDLGSVIKELSPGVTQKSATYRKQTPFHGSRRQVRGIILKSLSTQGSLSIKELLTISKTSSNTLEEVLSSLKKEGFIGVYRNTVTLR